MRDLGRTAYVAYGEATEGLNFLGEPMPEWDDLPQQIRDAWRASAKAVRGEGAAMSVTVGDLDVIASCLMPGCWRQFRGDAAADAMARWYDHLGPAHPGWDGP